MLPAAAVGRRRALALCGCGLALAPPRPLLPLRRQQQPPPMGVRRRLLHAGGGGGAGRGKPPRRRVCGMVILHRHGERAPMVNFYRSPLEDAHAAAAAKEEERRWLERLPTPEELARLQALFPVLSSAARVPRDRRSKPFGCLTQRGLEGMRQLGASLRELHPAVLKPPSPQSSRDGPDPSASSSSEGGSVAAAAAAFQAYSSNFARTQQSAQGLLDGLRGAKEEEELPVVVPVVVREERECTIHMYDNDPHTIKEEVGRVLRDPSFLARQDQQEALKADLVRLVPGLTDENFKWMEAADFFWCQPRGSDLELGPQLEALRDPTVEYVAWRFQQYYAHKPLLALVIAPLVQEVLATLRRMAATATGSTSSPQVIAIAPSVAVFSGHDVTVLAFLHALGWPRVRDPTWWPPYGCALVFELLEPAATAAGGAGGEGDDYRVRIRLDVLGQRVPISLPVLSERQARDAGKEEEEEDDDDDSISLADLGRWMQEQGLARLL